MRLDAIGALRRGFLNARANWQLVPMQWLFGLLFAFLLVLSLVPVVVAICWSVFQDLPSGFDQWMGWAERLPQILMARALPILIGLLVSLAIGVVAVWVYGYLLAGTYGVLAVGEAQAPRNPLPGTPGTLSWRQFVAFEWSGFHASGMARVWTYFWTIHLFFTLALVLMLIWALVIVAAVWAFQGYGGFAAFGIGCGGALPLVFLGVILSFWSRLAMIEATRRGASVLGAARAGFELLGKRLGAVLLLFLFQVIAGMILGAVFVPMFMFSELAFSNSPGMGLALRIPAQFVQWLISSAVQLIFMGAYLAIAHDRTPFEPAFPGIEPRTFPETGGAAESVGLAGVAGAASAPMPVTSFDRVGDEPMPDLGAPVVESPGLSSDPTEPLPQLPPTEPPAESMTESRTEAPLEPSNPAEPGSHE
jgi:hypothetical protein